MKLLSYDTSSEILSIAIHDDTKKLVEFNSPSFTRHSSSLVPALDKLFKRGKISLKDIECVAVGLGPGSFTGLRVGITTAKMLAYVLKLKLVGVSSLAAIAQEAPDWQGPIAVTLNARKDKLYAAVYEKKEKKLRVVQEPLLIKRDDFLKTLDESTLILGDKEPLYPKATAIAAIATYLIKEKKFTDPFHLEPQYLHPRDCNVMVRPTYLPAGRQAEPKP